MNSTPVASGSNSDLKKYWWVIALGVLLLLTILAGVFLLGRNNQTAQTNTTTQNTQTTPPPTQPSTNTQSANTIWEFDGSQWKSLGSTPKCDDPMIFTSPGKLSVATNILYPGQVRGGNYKPHGGIRFDGQTNDSVNVVAPADSYAYRGSRYIEAGEVQYMIDFIVPCGFMYRLDHLHTLTAKFQTLMDTLPEPTESTMTTKFSDTVTVEQGEEIATSVGFVKTSNVGFDWGLYDLREPNEASSDTTWASEHSNAKETAYFGVCWLDYLSEEDMQMAKALPGSGTEGKTSDYCD